MELRAPRKRRRIIKAVPELSIYLNAGEKMDALHFGLDSSRSASLLRLLSIAEDVQESTWFSLLGHRLLTEPKLLDRISKYRQGPYRDLPPIPTGLCFRIYTIPVELKAAIANAANSLSDEWLAPIAGQEAGRRGAVNPWLRIALCYCAFKEKKWTRESIPAIDELPD